VNFISVVFDYTRTLTQFIDVYVHNHESATAGTHPGLYRTWRKATLNFYMGGLFTVYQSLLGRCIVCVTTRPFPNAVPLLPILTSRKGELYVYDYSKISAFWFFSCIDHFTKHINGDLFHTKESINVRNSLYDYYMAGGVPER
jgi:hypothetical protein